MRQHRNPQATHTNTLSFVWHNFCLPHSKSMKNKRVLKTRPSRTFPFSFTFSSCLIIENDLDWMGTLTISGFTIMQGFAWLLYYFVTRYSILGASVPSYEEATSYNEIPAAPTKNFSSTFPSYSVCSILLVLNTMYAFATVTVTWLWEVHHLYEYCTYLYHKKVPFK